MAIMAPEAAEAAGPAAASALPSPSPPKSRGALLALGILLLWLAGLAFFFCFEGVQAESSGTNAGSLIKALIGGLSTKAQDLESQNAGQKGG